MTVFLNLFRCFKVGFIGIAVVVLTFIGCVIAADPGSGFINTAPIIGLKMFALGVNQQEPDTILDKQAGPIVHHEPSQVFEVIKI